LFVEGKYVKGETVAPQEKRNGTIEGGTRIKLSAGDVVRIPPRYFAPKLPFTNFRFEEAGELHKITLEDLPGPTRLHPRRTARKKCRARPTRGHRCPPDSRSSSRRRASINGA
jgi:hypothetical protein